MGYESKIFVCNVYNLHDDKDRIKYGNKIAVFDLCKMGYDKYNGKTFTQLFDTPINFDLFLDGDEDNEVTEDKYGDILTYTEDIDSVIEWLEEFITDVDYRRAELFLEFLVALQGQIVTNKWDNIVLVHYGY